MSPPNGIEERLADQLEQPPHERDAAGDVQLEALLNLAVRIDESWSAVEPTFGAEKRVYAEAKRLASEKKRRRLRLPTLPKIGWPARVGVAGAVAAIVLVLISVLGGPKISDEQILARAEAALVVGNNIVHAVSDIKTVDEPIEGITPRRVTRVNFEQYTYTRKVFHSHTFNRDRKGKLEREHAVEGKTTKIYDPETNTVKIYRTDEGTKGFTPRRDFVEGLKEAFTEDRVRVIGKTKVGKTPAYLIRINLTGREGLKTSKVDYYVDRDKFKPLLVKFNIKLKVRGADVASRTSQRYQVYELLQPTKENLKLLKLDKHPGAKVIRVEEE